MLKNQCRVRRGCVSSPEVTCWHAPSANGSPNVGVSHCLIVIPRFGRSDCHVLGTHLLTPLPSLSDLIITWTLPGSWHDGSKRSKLHSKLRMGNSLEEFQSMAGRTPSFLWWDLEDSSSGRLARSQGSLERPQHSHTHLNLFSFSPNPFHTLPAPTL